MILASQVKEEFDRNKELVDRSQKLTVAIVQTRLVRLVF